MAIDTSMNLPLNSNSARVSTTDGGDESATELASPQDIEGTGSRIGGLTSMLGGKGASTNSGGGGGGLAESIIDDMD